MNKRICLILLLLTCKICNAQNLVPNGDFEQYIGCPNGISQIDSALYWFSPSLGTTDYFNQCDTTNTVGVPNNNSGYQNAHSGIAYGGIGLYAIGHYREYLEIQLQLPLNVSTCYHFQMFVNSANNMKFATDALGIYFSDILINDPIWTNLLYNPQINNMSGFLMDTLNWTLISANYNALGGEEYIIIGNFKDDANTNIILQDSSAFNPYAYVFIDDVSLTPCTAIEEQNQNDAIKIYPNPLRDKVNITISNNELSEIILYDIATRKILQQEFRSSVTLNTEQLEKGIYIYEVRNKNGLCKKGKVVKD